MTYFACVPSCYSMSLGCCFSHGGYDSLDAGRRSGIVLLVIVIKWQWDNWLLCFWLYHRLVFLMPQIAPENEEICSWKWLKENVRYCLSATLAVIITSALLSFHIWPLLLGVKICSCQGRTLSYKDWSSHWIFTRIKSGLILELLACAFGISGDILMFNLKISLFLLYPNLSCLSNARYLKSDSCIVDMI